MHASTHEPRALADPATDAAPTGWTPDFIDEVLDVVAEPATVTNAFRYTDQELTELTDVLYDVAKRFRVKVSKQDVARLGLTAVLREYQQREETSLLAALVRRKRQRGRSDTP